MPRIQIPKIKFGKIWQAIFVALKFLRPQKPLYGQPPTLSPPGNDNEFWHEIVDNTLSQGDLMLNCSVPRFDSFIAEGSENGITYDVYIDIMDLIVLTHGCDLSNNPPSTVTLCHVCTTTEFDADNQEFVKNNGKKRWEGVRKNRHTGLHLLASPIDPENASKSLVVNFLDVHTLSYQYLVELSKKEPIHWRLKSPYLEDLSHRFGEHFSRVGKDAEPPVIE